MDKTQFETRLAELRDRHNAAVVESHPTAYAEALVDYLRARFTGTVSDDLHPIALREARDGTSLRSMIEKAIGGGEIAPAEFVRTLTSSDATLLLAQALNHVVTGNIGHVDHRVLCATRDVPNFKTTGIAAIHVGDVAATPVNSDIQPVEAIDIGGAGVTGQLALYTAGLRVARSLLVNDDVGAIAAAVEETSRALLRAEAKLFASTLEGAVTLADGAALFGASNAFTGGAPSVTTLDAAADMLATQVNSQGAKSNAPLNAILIPPTKLASAWTLNEALGGKLTIVASPWLSGSYWYAFANPSAQPAIVRLRLAGRDLPTVEERRDFESDGVGFRLEHMVGFRPFDRRGVVRVALS